ncbi:MAG TPA: prepilin-type N-terminal cleavage/methylation domain-containing protein [Gemmatimonadota bacterium]|nr:prepilin-type N-terminal cleavage/methylation domain-containing protein [Gemmatimonadota bacterium]
MNRRPTNGASGFTAIELIVALTLGTIVMAAAIRYVITEFRVLTANDIREVVARNGRYVAVSLRRDVQRAGVGIETTTTFGTVDTWPGTNGDTLMILYVPYRPQQSPAHVIVPPEGTDNPLPAGGTCGPQCMEVLKTGLMDLHVGDLARLQVLGSRRLVLIQAINEVSDTSVQLGFTDADRLLRQPAGLTDLSLDRFASFVQKLRPTLFYLDEQNRLMRAVRLNLDGSPAGEVLAYGVAQFEVQLIFADGDVFDQVNTVDTDDSNDYDDVVAVQIRATLQADRTHPLVNQGAVLERTFEWRVSPRNLRYEKDRL